MADIAAEVERLGLESRDDVTRAAPELLRRCGERVRECHRLEAEAFGLLEPVVS
jgi:hypothetical protein